MKKEWTVCGSGIDIPFSTNDINVVYDAVLNLSDGAIIISCDTVED